MRNGLYQRATLETRTEVELNPMKSLRMNADEVLRATRVLAKNGATLLKIINERLTAEIEVGSFSPTPIELRLSESDLSQFCEWKRVRRFCFSVIFLLERISRLCENEA